METKQTAVEWLQESLQPHLTHEQIRSFEGLFQQAIGMYKEQITDAYTIGSYDMAEKEFRPEQYYNETYNETDFLQQQIDKLTDELEYYFDFDPYNHLAITEIEKAIFAIEDEMQTKYGVQK